MCGVCSIVRSSLYKKGSVNTNISVLTVVMGRGVRQVLGGRRERGAAGRRYLLKGKKMKRNIGGRSKVMQLLSCPYKKIKQIKKNHLSLVDFTLV